MTCCKGTGGSTNKSEMLHYSSLCVARYLLLFHQRTKVYV